MSWLLAALTVITGCGSDAGLPDRLRCGESRESGCFVAIPATRSRRGAQATDPSAPGHDPAAAPDEGPVVEIAVAAFALQAEEVTRAQWTLCVEAGACSPAPLEGVSEAERVLPVTRVTRDDAAAYCRWLGGRLPTDAEWEVAARGPEGRRFPWGDALGCGTADPVARGDLARMAAPPCAGTGPLPAAELRGRSPYGIGGMAGNVAEWVADPYPGDPTLGVVRGGSFTAVDPLELRAAARWALPPGVRLLDVGVRCAGTL